MIEDIPLQRRHYIEDITLTWLSNSTEMFLKKGPYHVVKYTGKRPRCNVSLVKLLDKFTRITPYLTAQNKVSLIQSPGEEMSHKRTVSTDFQLHCPKFCGNFVQENFSSKKLDERAAFHAMWVISSIFYMNFTEANPHWIRECN